MNRLLEQLRTLPEFNKFEKAVKDTLNKDNGYVQEFMPEVGTFVDYDDEGHKFHFSTSEEQAEEEGIDGLLDDDEGYFADYAFDMLREDTLELIRALVKELRKEGSV